MYMRAFTFLACLNFALSAELHMAEGAETQPWVVPAPPSESESGVTYIVKFGSLYTYTIPGFSVITVKLRHAKVQWVSNDGGVKLVDAFVNEEMAPQMHPPTCVEVIESCFVKVRCANWIMHYVCTESFTY